MDDPENPFPKKPKRQIHYHLQKYFNPQPKRKTGLDWTTIWVLSGLFFACGTLIYIVKNDPANIEANLYEAAAYKALYAQHPPHPTELKKIRGKVAFVDTYYSTNHYGPGKGWSNLIPHRRIHLKNVKEAFLLPDYTNLVISTQALETAKSIELQYYEDIRIYYDRYSGRPEFHKLPPPGKDADGVPILSPYPGNSYFTVDHRFPYYDAVGLTVEGTTYLTPLIVKIMDFAFWTIAIIVLACGLFSAAFVILYYREYGAQK